MLDAQTRPVKERVLAPLAMRLERVHPITMTGLSLLAGLVAAGLAWRGLYGLALLFWFLNRTADGLDGTLARAHRRQSDLGAYLDILSDFLVYALLPLGLVLSRPEPALFISLALLLTVYYVNGASWMYLAALLEKRLQGARQRGEMTSVTMPAGLIGGTETVIFYALFLLFPQWLVWLFALFTILIGLTIIQRLVWAARALS